MKSKKHKDLFENLPGCAAEFIKLVIRKMRYRKKIRADVQAELAAHFEDELHDCRSDEEKEQKAKQLIEQFGDAKLLAVLLRRAKKRCRPLWRTLFARTFQTAGILVLCLVVYLVWFFSGKPAITTDYVAEYNRMVQPVADESLNAAPLYNEAAQRYSELPEDISNLIWKKYYDANDTEKQLMKKWLTDNKETIDLVIAGTKKPYCWQKYEGEEMIAVLMPHLAEFRRLAYSLRWRAHLSAEQGRYKDVFDDIKVCYRLGRHLRGDKTLIEQLVGIAIEAIALRTARDILSKYDIDSTALAELQQNLEQMIINEDFTVSLKARRLCMYDEIQRCFTEDRLGGGHLYPSRIMGLSDQAFGDSGDSRLDEVIFKFIATPIVWLATPKAMFLHPDKQETKEMADRFYDYWEKICRKSPYQINVEGIDIENESMEIIKGNMLLEIFVPALGRVNQVSHRLVTDVRATLTIIAALRYRQDNSRLPDTLQELVTEGYLKKLPIDPHSDKPLVYKKTEDGFTLYSVGTNFTDDGGKVARNEKGRVKRYADQGDWVFWPNR